jgi:hypothetical protein
LAVSSTFSATLDSSSLKSRSRRLRLVTYLPSLPTNGESFTLNIMVSVGGSISSGLQRLGIGGVADAVANVDGFQADQRDDVAGGASSAFLRPKPSNTWSCCTLLFTVAVIALDDRTCWPVLITPL